MWLRADRGVTLSVGKVSQWNDQSAQANHCAQAVPGEQPLLTPSTAGLNNQTSIAFADVEIMASNANLAYSGGGYTIMVAARYATLDNFDGLFRISSGADTGADGVCAYATAAGRVVFGATDASTYYLEGSVGLVLSNTSYIFTFRSSGAAGNIRMNGTDVTAGFVLNGVWGTPGAYPFRPGGGWSSAGSRMEGNIAEHVVYNRNLSNAECLSLEQYMGARYGITVP
jgi:hypothetical protein